MGSLSTLLLKDVVKQFLASGDLYCMIFEIFVGAYLGPFYDIFQDRFGETFEKQVCDFGVAGSITGFVA